MSNTLPSWENAMQAMRMRRRIESETLHLPELRAFLEKDVEIIVLESAPQAGERPVPTERSGLRASVLRYDDPLRSVRIVDCLPSGVVVSRWLRVGAVRESDLPR
jgi:hypothetical protein